MRPVSKRGLYTRKERRTGAAQTKETKARRAKNTARERRIIFAMMRVGGVYSLGGCLLGEDKLQNDSLNVEQTSVFRDRFSVGRYDGEGRGRGVRT